MTRTYQLEDGRFVYERDIQGKPFEKEKIYFDNEKELRFYRIDQFMSLRCLDHSVYDEIYTRFKPKKVWNGNFRVMTRVNGQMEPMCLYYTVDADKAFQLFDEYANREIQIRLDHIHLSSRDRLYFDEYKQSEMFDKRKKEIFREITTEIARYIRVKPIQPEPSENSSELPTVINNIIGNFINRSKAPTLSQGWFIFILALFFEIILHHTISLWVMTTMLFVAWRRTEIKKYNSTIITKIDEKKGITFK